MALNYVQLFQALLNKKEQERQRKEAQQQGLWSAIGTVAGGVGGFFLGGPPGAMIGATAGGQLGKVGAGGAYTPQDAASLITSGLGSLGAAQAADRTAQSQEMMDLRIHEAGLEKYNWRPGVDASDTDLVWLGQEAYQKLDTEGYDPASIEALFATASDDLDMTVRVPLGKRGYATFKRADGGESDTLPAGVSPRVQATAEAHWYTGAPIKDMATNTMVFPQDDRYEKLFQREFPGVDVSGIKEKLGTGRVLPAETRSGWNLPLIGRFGSDWMKKDKPESYESLYDRDRADGGGSELPAGGPPAVRAGDVIGGYEFLGGNPDDPKNWRKVL